MMCRPYVKLELVEPQKVVEAEEEEEEEDKKGEENV